MNLLTSIRSNQQYLITRDHSWLLGLLIAIGINVQVYTINIMMSIQIVSIGIDVIRFATTILTIQFQSN